MPTKLVKAFEVETSRKYFVASVDAFQFAVICVQVVPVPAIAVGTDGGDIIVTVVAAETAKQLPL